MKLIVGLGNPGKQYDHSWHNLGFAVADQLRKNFDFPAYKKSTKFQADIADGQIASEKILLAKPLTYMNNSGESVKAIASYYKLKPADIIVIHDDIDLPLGKIRLTHNSTAGGHNGVKSIIDCLAGKNFQRIKIGIKTDRPAKIDSADYVLMTPDPADRPAVKSQISLASDAVKDLLESGLAKAMNKWN